MLKNIVNGFEEMMNSIMAVVNESYNDKYAGWNEGVWKHALFSFSILE